MSLADMGKRVTLERKARDWSQAELGRRVGISTTNIRDIERGHIDRTGYVVDIAQVFGVTAEWLQFGKSPKRFPSAIAKDPSTTNGSDHKMLLVHLWELTVVHRDGNSYVDELEGLPWGFPDAWLRAELRCDIDDLKIYSVKSHSLTQYRPGTRLVVNTKDRVPDQSGHFVINRAIGLAHFELEYVEGSRNPVLVRVSSNNPDDPMISEQPLNEIDVIGRIVAVAWHRV